jgi:hypothetical protein
MRYLKLAAAAAIITAPALLSADIASAQAQPRDCMVSGNLAPIGFNSEGTIEMNAGESCNMFLNTSGTIDSAKISQAPKNGTLRLAGAGNAVYTPKAGWRGTDEFAVTVSGRGLTASGTSVVKIRANVK